MTRYSFDLPQLALDMTTSFAARTGLDRVKRPGANSFGQVLDTMAGLMSDARQGHEFIVMENDRPVARKFEDIARVVMASPVLQAASGETIRAGTGDTGLARQFTAVRDAVNDLQLSDKPLTDGQAYLISVMLLNHLQDRQETPVRGTNGSYQIEEYTPATHTRQARAFLLA